MGIGVSLVLLFVSCLILIRNIDNCENLVKNNSKQKLNDLIEQMLNMKFFFLFCANL